MRRDAPAGDRLRAEAQPGRLRARDTTARAAAGRAVRSRPGCVPLRRRPVTRTLQPVWYSTSIPSHSNATGPLRARVQLRAGVGSQHDRVAVEGEVHGEDERAAVDDDREPPDRRNGRAARGTRRGRAPRARSGDRSAPPCRHASASRAAGPRADGHLFGGLVVLSLRRELRREHGGLGAALHAQLREQVRHVVLDRLLRQEQAARRSGGSSAPRRSGRGSCAPGRSGGRAAGLPRDPCATARGRGR